MSFDARSRERLEALGRTLPQKLPSPVSSPGGPAIAANSTGTPGAGTTGESRHRLEKEQDPAELFRVLMQSSPDGTVPPHLLERLRELEAFPTSAPSHSPGIPSSPPAKGSKTQVAKTANAKIGSAKTIGQGRRVSGVGKDEQDLYSAFAQRLLDDDDA